MNDYLSLITSEHRDKPKFSALVETVAGAFGGVYDFCQALPAQFDLDQAAGTQLDIIGLWVGQSRVIPGILTVAFFGFSDNPAAQNFGEEGNASIGGRFYEEGESYTGSSILADTEYRTILRAKIVKNHAEGLTADIIAALTFIFNAPTLIDDPGTMAIDVYVGRPLTLAERAILTQLDILPRPAGVRIRTIGYFNSFDGYLGFEGQAGAVPFAEEGYVGPIGQLLEEITQ